MSLTPGHPAKDWWRESASGQRTYALPPELHSFTVPPFEVEGLRGVRLGASTDAVQAQLAIDFATQIAQPLEAAAAGMPDVAKFAPDAYGALGNELADLFSRQDALEQRVNQLPLPASEHADLVDALYRDMAALSAPVASFKLRVSQAGRAGVEGRQLRTAVIATFAGAAAVGLGWYVFVRSGVRLKRRR